MKIDSRGGLTNSPVYSDGQFAGGKANPSLLLFLLFLLFPLSSVSSETQQQIIRVACVGNSVTYGYGLPDRETQAYPVLLQRMLGEGYEVRNFGHSGTTLLRHGHRPYMQQSEFREALDFHPDWVIIHLGLNDTDPRNWPDYADEFVPDYLALIDSFRVTNPQVKIWICLMTPIGHRHHRFQSGTHDWHGAIQQAIQRVAKTANVGLIDLNAPLYNRPDLFPDALHPNPEGAKILAKIVYQALSGDYGGLQVPEIYGSGMVIQRECPIQFHGKADVGEKVSVVFNGIKRIAKTKEDGQWEVELPMMAAGGPYSLSFQTSKRQIQFDDVWVGDVWLCSGQSNMEFPLEACYTAEEDLANADSQTLLHIYNMPARYPTNHVEWDSDVLDSVNHLRYLHQRGWQACSKESVKDFSAIAYHIGRVLADSLQVHVGIICNAVGGTTTESWIDRNTLESYFPPILYDWYHGDFGQPWARERAMKNIAKASSPLQRHPYEPCYMFEAGIMPLEHYAIKGVAWYQGESNAHNIELHERLFTLMEMSWRYYFHDPELPFYVVQLSSLNRPSWPRFRDSQRRLADQLDDTWLVVSHDLGDSLDVHFPKKRPLGERLAHQMLQHSYEFDIETDSPTLNYILTDGNKMFITFYNGDSCQVDGEQLLGFEIAGRDSVYYKADAQLAEGIVVLSSPQVSAPVYVRYAWQPFTRANLKQFEGMPLSAFSSQANLVVEPLIGFPDGEKGIDQGVSACYAGVIDDYLIMAGGCNFPDVPAAEGGKKQYYRGIYAARLNDGNSLKWERVGWLPVAAAYGVSVTTSDGVICVGGNNEESSLQSVFKIRMEDGKAVTEPLPLLPVALDNFTGTIQDDLLIVYGGHQVYALDLDQMQKGWQLLNETKKELRQPVSGFINGNYYVWGGYTPKTKRKKASLSLDGVQFDANDVYEVDGPTAIDDEKVFLGGAAAVNLDELTLVAMGGVNKDIFLKALNHPDPDYMTHPVEWYQFNPYIFVYLYDRWITVGASEHVARAGAALVKHDKSLYLIGGELKPGIRTPSVCRIQIKQY